MPTWLTDHEDMAVRAVVAQADPPAKLIVTSTYGVGESDPTAGAADTTAGIDDAARDITASLPQSLRRVLGPPVAAATSTDLKVSTPRVPTGGVLWMSYLWAGHEPAVRWLAGVAPGRPGPDGAVQLALSDEVARALGLGAGDTFEAVPSDHSAVPVLVTGVFEARDTRDPVWKARPEVLRPQGGSSAGSTTVVGGLLSAASLPAARAALEPDGVTRTFRFPVDPQALDYGGSAALVTQLAALEAAPALLNAPGPQPTVTSQLDQLLPLARERVAATWSQAIVVLAGLACAAVLVILVAAELLARRRSVALHTMRARGATLVGIAGRVGAESAVVVGLGAAVGVTVGVVVAPGAVTWLWVVVVVVAGLLAPPAFATMTAARSDARRVPTDWHHRRRVQRVAHGEASVVRGRGGRASRSLRWPPCAGVASRRSPAPPTRCSRLRRCSSRLPARCCCGAPSPRCSRAYCGLRAGLAGPGRCSPWREPMPLDPRWRSWRSSWSSRSSRCAVRSPARHGSVRWTARGTRWARMPLCARRCRTRRWRPSRTGWPQADGVDAVAVGRVQAGSPLFGVPGVEEVRVLAVDPAAYGKLLARTPFGAAPELAVLADASSAATTRAAPGALPALVPGPLLGTRPTMSWGWT